MAPKAIRRRALSAGQTHKAMEARMRNVIGARRAGGSGNGRGLGFTLQDRAGSVTLQHNALGRDPIELINANGDPTEHGKRGIVSRGLNPLQLFVTANR